METNTLRHVEQKLRAIGYGGTKLPDPEPQYPCTEYTLSYLYIFCGSYSVPLSQLLTAIYSNGYYADTAERALLSLHAEWEIVIDCRTELVRLPREPYELLMRWAYRCRKSICASAAKLWDRCNAALTCLVATSIFAGGLAFGLSL